MTSYLIPAGLLPSVQVHAAPVKGGSDAVSKTEVIVVIFLSRMVYLQAKYTAVCDNRYSAAVACANTTWVLCARGGTFHRWLRMYTKKTNQGSPGFIEGTGDLQWAYDRYTGI